MLDLDCMKGLIFLLASKHRENHDTTIAVQFLSGGMICNSRGNSLETKFSESLESFMLPPSLEMGASYREP